MGPSGVGDGSDFPGHSRGVDATILVLCDIRTVLCSSSTLRLLSVLHHTTHLVLVVLQTGLGRHPRAGKCTSIETVMWFDSGLLFLSCELAASIVFRDNVDGVGENISGCVRPYAGFPSVLDYQIPFRPLEDVQELFLQTLPIFHGTVRPWHDIMGTVHRYLGNEE